MSASPIILVPGFWLGAWAWDEVAAILRADGLDVTALTLPGLESAESDRSRSPSRTTSTPSSTPSIGGPLPAVLVLHSATGFSGYAASDRAADRIAAMVYVDTAPGRARSTPGSRASRSRCLGRDRGGGEPRRTQPGAARDVPAAGGARARRDAPRGRRTHQRRAARHPEHDHRDRVPGGGIPAIRAREGLRSSRASRSFAT